MIGWDQASIEARLGPPARVVEGFVPDANAQNIRSGGPGAYRTLLFRRGFHGRFVAWMRAEGDRFVCVGSKWDDRGVYY